MSEQERERTDDASTHDDGTAASESSYLEGDQHRQADAQEGGDQEGAQPPPDRPEV